MGDASWWTDPFGVKASSALLPVTAGLVASSEGPLRLRDFIAGAENVRVVAAVQALLTDWHPDRSPLLIHGPRGCGKTHLLEQLPFLVPASTWDGPIVRCDATQLSRRTIAGQGADEHQAWRGRTRSAGLLILDRLELLTSRPKAQIELRYLLDELDRRGAPVVAASRRPLWNLPGLMPSLASRLSAGTVLALAPPDALARREILHDFSDRRGIPLPDQVTHLLAERVPGSVHGLLSACVAVQALAERRAQPLDPQTAADYLQRRAALGRPTAGQIGRATAHYFQIRLATLRSDTRQQSAVRARSVAMYLMRQFTSRSLLQIGAYFGGRDHTTVLHACRRVAEQVPHDAEIARAIHELTARWEAS